jgi:formylglycine-generating enzyme required for sulfatase activity/nucleoside phosphorylase/predicted MPP superfamily phosphohydrolase
MMSELKILHLSDLHYDSSESKDTKIVLAAFLRDLDRDDEDDLGFKFEDIDVILFTGDLVNAGDNEDDFEEVFQVFIKPLLNKTRLKEDCFFLVPGNHDIQKSAIDEIVEEGLKAKLTDRDPLNSFLDVQIEKGFTHIERLIHFNNFKARFNKRNMITSNRLFSTHKIKKKNVNIGIACLNSCWRATAKGSGHDYGKLLIGERQVDDSLNDIKNCNLKIAMYHHPLEWLMAYDKRDVERLLSKSCDLIFCGHHHVQNLQLVQNFTDKFVLMHGGSLYKGRGFFNGYSVLCLNVSTGEGTIYLRSYFDGRRVFDKAVNIWKNGKMDIKIGNHPTNQTQKDIDEPLVEEDHYLECDYDGAKHFKGRLSTLILTSTKDETVLLHRKMKPLPNYDKLLRVFKGSWSYYIGVLGYYAVVQVQCEIRALESYGSTAVTAEAINAWEPKAVIVIGTAISINNKEQNIGDVLISDTIIPYSINLVDSEKTIHRSPINEISNILYNRFNPLNWRHQTSKDKTAKIIQGHILSGVNLVNNFDFFDSSLKAFPDAKGLEVKASGPYLTSVKDNLPWIVVKGICCRADNEKIEIKNKDKEIAIKSVISLCIKVFSTAVGFKELGFLPLNEEGKDRDNIKTKEDSKPKETESKPEKNLNELIRIPSGEAILGANNEILTEVINNYGLSGDSIETLATPKTYIAKLPEYYISKFAVSNDEYREFVRSTGWREPSHWQSRNTKDKTIYIGDHPVVNVNFLDAEVFCQWKGVQLPTNDQWERAARGADGRAYPWGNNWSASKGNYKCNTRERHKSTGEELVPVHAFPEYSSPEGLLNAAGNVWEWVDGGERGMKHSRGGSWDYQGDLYSLLWFRMKTEPDIIQNDQGFRYVKINDKKIDSASIKDLDGVVSIPGDKYRIGIKSEQIAYLLNKFDLSEGDEQIFKRNESRKVSIKTFQIRIYIVTNEEYYEFVRKTGHQWPEYWQPQMLKWSDRPFLEKYRFHPITHVNYKDASNFCSWRGVRLPTNEEWEVAARRDCDNIYPWGKEFNPGWCNFSEFGLARTNRVDEFKSGCSPFGCFDMAGNVQEWVAPDKDGEYFVRGGAYKHKGALYGLTFLCIPADPEFKSPHLGFRYVI